jgi:hypothetical protein
MKHRYEEDLIRLAFGELQGPEEERARSLVREDARAEELYRQYCDIREGLGQLPTPDHQLSTERLRHAILDRGLAPERRGIGWRWSWAPGLATIAVAALFLRLQPWNPVGPFESSNSKQELGRELTRSADLVRSAMTDKASSPDEAGAPFGALAPAKAPASPVVAVRSGSRSAPTEAARDAAGRSVLVALASKVDIATAAIEGAVSEGMADPEAWAPVATEIVLIGSETDAATGASRAIEVSSAANVVVGG